MSETTYQKRTQFVLDRFFPVLFTLYTTSHGRLFCSDLLFTFVTLKTSYGGIRASLSASPSLEYSETSAPEHVTISKHDLSPNRSALEYHPIELEVKEPKRISLLRTSWRKYRSTLRYPVRHRSASGLRALRV